MKALGWTDGSNGSSRSDCGAAAYVIATADTHTVIEERAQPYPHTDSYRFTNNDMEMVAIKHLLEAALRIGVNDLTVHCDSEWCVRILLKEYRLKQEKFVPLVDEIYSLAGQFDYIEIKHVRRELNSRADWLCRGATAQSRPVRAPALVKHRSGRSRPQRS